MLAREIPTGRHMIRTGYRFQPISWFTENGTDLSLRHHRPQSG
jgi:hypothetical protein